ncbi:MAG: hypothetical protein MI861_27175, partial [Pirellulales bacterium]|nr:hypothetical protein [Pirellulales bacterium]
MKKLSLSKPFLFRVCLLVISVTGWCLHQPAAGQQTAPPAAVILQATGQRDLETALQALGKVVDQPVTIGELAYSGLPAAAGGLHRYLAQLSSDEQYEVLEKWTLPEQGRQAVRLFAIPVPTDAPPKVFARSLGERPRDTTFSIAQVGPVRGFFCSGWMLVKAADDLGRITRLRSTLEELVQQDVTGSRELLMLAYLAGSRGQLDQVQAYLQKHAEPQAENQEGLDELTPQDILRAAIASASLPHEELQPLAESFLQTLVDRSGNDSSIGLRPFLRLVHATAVQVHRGESSPAVLFHNRLKHWLPV